MTKMVKDGGEERDLRFADVEVEVEMNAEDAAAAVGGGDGVVPNPNGFDPMDLLDVNDASIFYDDFPPLPDFPCMSSSSSTSSTPPASKVVSRPIGGASSSSSSTSSPAASWAMMEEDSARMSFQQMNDEMNVNPNAAVDLSSTASMDIPPPSEFADCVDVMENFELIDLIDDCNELWDPSSVFQTENPQEFEAAAPPQGNKMICGEEEEENDDGFSFLKGNSDLAMIFFEWLKQNKDYISAEDMRSIKLKRSTIESASKRLGSSKEGKKQLLKLILEWVEQYQLQKKARLREGGAVAAAAAQSPYAFDETPLQISNPNPNPNFIYNSDPNTNFQTPQWMPPPPPPHVSEVAPPPDFPPPMHGYTTNPYNPTQIPMNHGVVNGIPYQHSSEYPLMDHAPAWAIPPFPVAPPPPFSPFPDNANILNRQQSLYGNPYQMFDPNGERTMRLGSSATKEARKKRMARQRRLYSHHRHSSNSNQNQNQLNDLNQIGDGVEDCDHGGSPGNLMYWSKGGGAAANLPSAEASQPNPGDRTTAQPRQAPSDRRQQQGWKTEKNLKFLLQKVLKQSDVGNLGRIVLPKKEAESHLPELESRDGISIAMEDIGTSRIWNMRYRFWPNNKSRMYLLENTGDFVRVNGLQEGDFIVIYSDTKCGKYMIRGVKVRQPGGKSEGKKPARRNIRNLSSLAGNNSPLAPIRQAVR